MIIPFLHRFIFLGPNCDFSCFYCPLWVQGKTKLKSKSLSVPPPKLLKSRVLRWFFTTHLVGGDPLKNEHILTVCRQFAGKKMRLSLWTQGQYACDIYRQLLPYISHFYIYLPAANEERFIAVSGQAKFKEMDLVVDYLKEQQKKVTISHLVTPDNIEFLPEVYEYSYQKNLPLLLHYRKASLFSKESIGFIKRFRRVPGVTVYEGTENEFLCLAVPYGADRRVFQFFRRCWSQLIKLVTVKLGR